MPSWKKDKETVQKRKIQPMVSKVLFMRDKFITVAINRTSFSVLTSFEKRIVNIVFAFFCIGILFVKSPFYSYLLKNKHLIPLFQYFDDPIQLQLNVRVL